MRHRAALGMSEVSDAIIIAVSEETGGISIAQDSEIKRAIPPEALRANLLRALRKTEQKTTDKSSSKSEAPAKS
jgi:diadenylate cyclase